MNNARIAAFEIVEDVLVKKRDLDQALNNKEKYKNLNGPDRGFARMMASTILRENGRINAVIQTFLKKPEPITPYTGQIVLMIGVVQLLFMRVPSHAAINETVELCSELKVSKLKGLVNAVLRQVDEKGRAIISAMDQSINVPDWLKGSWMHDYGDEEANLIIQSSMSEAPIDISLKKQDEQTFWSENLGGTLLPNGSIRLNQVDGRIEDLPGFHDGAWWVQDMAASMPAILLGNVSEKSVLDMCAAPGGKTMQLAAAGAKVTALDRSTNRMKRLNENADRMKFDKIETVIADALNWEPTDKFDFILMDAPCSATGTIRRHPDLLHLRTPKDLEKLTKLQSNMLNKLPSWLKLGGTVIYSVCSLQKDEGEKQINNFLERHTNFVREPFTRAEVFDMHQLITRDGDVRMLPHYMAGQGGMDGFFISRLRSL